MPPTQDDTTTPATEPQVPQTNPEVPPMPTTPVPTPPQDEAIDQTDTPEPLAPTPGMAPTTEPEADGYYGDAEPAADELDLKFLDEEKAADPTRDLPKAP